MTEVLLDMENTNALITVAMLAAIYENQQKDYLDIIKPFVCNLLPARNEYIDFFHIKQHMESEYGFVNMPIGVIENIVDRLCRDVTGLCSKQKSRYFMCGVYDNSDFRAKRLSIKSACADVSSALKEYLNSERALNVDEARCTSELLKFLDCCGHRVLKNTESMRSLPVDERMGRYIACFIQNEKKKSSTIYDHVIELARGYMVYRCIYFFSESGIEQSNFSLKNVVVYLDTPLIINALGLDTEIRRQAVWDAINLAKSLGARVTVLQHNVEEAQGILNAYIAAYPRVQTFALQNITSKEYSCLTIRSIADRLPEKIASELNEQIDTAPGLGTSSDWDQINTEEALRQYYLKSIQGKENDDIKLLRIENDVRTLSYAMQLRNGDRPKQFANCKVIVLSDSKTARLAAKALYDSPLSRDEIDLVYGLNDFSCIAWLSSSSPSAEIAEDLLMYNASAALEAPDAVIEKMLKYVDELTETGAIGEKMAFLLRTHPAVKEAAAEVVGNSEDNFTPAMLNAIYDEAVAGRAAEMAASQYEPYIKGLSDQLKERDLREQEMADELKRERDKESKRHAKLSCLADEKSDKFKNRIIWILTGIIRVFQIAVIFFVLYSIVFEARDGFSDETPMSILQMCALLFALISAVDFFIPKFKFADKWIHKFANFVADRKWHREMEKGKKYLDM